MQRRMKRERINRGWSYEDVSAKVGVSAETIRLIETGQRNPSYPLLIKLEDLFEMNHRDLFEDE